MGGGVEIALACDYRTISGGVPAVALPECFLGLVPGWGGCYLLPQPARCGQGPHDDHRERTQRPTGCSRASAAFELGIADAMFAPAEFLEAFHALGSRRRRAAR
jgi:enoyl-CoA hydratase/carnithine racemase